MATQFTKDNELSLSGYGSDSDNNSADQLNLSNNIDHTAINKKLLDKKLLEAAKSGNLEQVRDLIEVQGANIKYSFDGNALHKAIENDHLNVVQYLLDKDSSLIFEKDNMQIYPLSKGINYKKSNAVIKLVLQKVSLFYKQNPTKNIRFILIEGLNSAARQGNIEIADLILKVGGDKLIFDEAEYDRDFSFLDAVFSNQVEMVKFLLEKSKSFWSNCSPTKSLKSDKILEKCQGYGDLEILKVLLKAGFMLTPEGTNDFRYNYTKTWGQLHCSAYLNSNPKAQKVIFLSAAESFLNFARILFRLNKDLSYSKLQEFLEILGTAVNACDSEGNTALHYAVNSQNRRWISALLAAEADCDIKNKKGLSPFELALNLKEADNLIEKTQIINLFKTHMAISKIQSIIEQQIQLQALQSKTQNQTKKQGPDHAEVNDSKDLKDKMEVKVENEVKAEQDQNITQTVEQDKNTPQAVELKHNAESEGVPLDTIYTLIDEVNLAIDSLVGEDRLEACYRFGMLLGNSPAKFIMPKIATKFLSEVVKQSENQKHAKAAGKCLFELLSGRDLPQSENISSNPGCVQLAQASLDDEETLESEAKETAEMLEALLKDSDYALSNGNFGNLAASFFGRRYGIQGLGKVTSIFDVLAGLRKLVINERAEAQEALRAKHQEMALLAEENLKLKEALSKMQEQRRSNNSPSAEALPANVQVPAVPANAQAPVLPQYTQSLQATEVSVAANKQVVTKTYNHNL